MRFKHCVVLSKSRFSLALGPGDIRTKVLPIATIDMVKIGHFNSGKTFNTKLK